MRCSAQPGIEILRQRQRGMFPCHIHAVQSQKHREGAGKGKKAADPAGFQSSDLHKNLQAGLSGSVNMHCSTEVTNATLNYVSVELCQMRLWSCSEQLQI